MWASYENMTLRTKTYIYLALAAVGILANFALRGYRHHLYDLNTDYVREPFQQIQTILLGATEAFIVVGLAFLAWWKFSGRK